MSPMNPFDASILLQRIDMAVAYGVAALRLLRDEHLLIPVFLTEPLTESIYCEDGAATKWCVPDPIYRGPRPRPCNTNRKAREDEQAKVVGDFLHHLWRVEDMLRAHCTDLYLDLVTAHHRCFDVRIGGALRTEPIAVRLERLVQWLNDGQQSSRLWRKLQMVHRARPLKLKQVYGFTLDELGTEMTRAMTSL